MNNLTISVKLKLLLLLPLLGLFIFAGLLITDQYQSYKNYERLNHVVSLSTEITAMVHELQKERGMTAGFLGTNGIKFKDKLPLQRKLSSQKIDMFINDLATFETKSLPPMLNTLIQNALDKLNSIKSIRTKVTQLSISGKEAIAYYTQMNGAFLEVVRATTVLSKDNMITRQLISYTNFLLAKERAGIERAVGAVTFANDIFAPQMKLKFIRLISEQNAYLNSFENMTNQETLSYYKNTLQGKSINEVQRMRDIALNASDEKEFNVDSFYWFKTISEKINKLKQIDDFLAKKLISTANMRAHTAKVDMGLYIGFSLVIILLAIILGQYITNDLRKGVNNLSQGIDNFFKFLNKECSDVQIIEMNRKDIIGRMANKVNENIEHTKAIILDDIQFMQEVKGIVEKIKEGYLYQRLQYDAKSSNLQELKQEINEMLDTMNHTIGGSVNKITDVLNSYSNLDFTNNIKDASGTVEVSILNVGNMVTTMLQTNKKNGLTIEKSSEELLHNVDTLNVSASQAAASLEETAAALEEITSSIAQNAQNVTQMSTYAKEVTHSVESGQELANDTTAAMNEINEQVGAITDAITIIDQIAFQTNILSLNAAVEAATAGEAGKGFAVVAAEVRNLASRSAEAATEIKTLVEHAIEKANAGKEIAHKMTQGYSNLNNNITQTIELINDVTLASKEQSEGIAQINDAVAILDQQTQNNANVASKTAQIASNTKSIANHIVEDTNEKQFNGKENIQAN